MADDVIMGAFGAAEAEAQDDELMDEWLQVLRRKKELVDKEAKLLLK